jgi:predicted transcriptional regulator
VDGVVQVNSITGKKSSISIQLFSNLKRVDFGMEVSMEITQGSWLEVVIASPRAILVGTLDVQANEEKNQSSLWSRGALCMLLHVNLLHLRGMPTKPR